jgi:formylglycine-generating enzyme required for sulfatase activity
VDDPAQLASFLPQRPPRFTVGATVPGLESWTLVEPLGAGGFGEVWKAENPYVGFAAFKFFLDPLARKRFTDAEAKALAEILRRGPTNAVVRLLNAEPKQNPPWLQFEYIEGGDLSALPDSWKGLPDGERVGRVHGVIRTLAATAGHFHALGVVHRDLKPSNILRRADGALVVADFGISKIVPDGAVALPTPANSGTATPRAYTALYASPEQKKFQPANRRDDVYALGVLWYQLLRGDLTLERPSGDGWKKVLTRLGVPDAAVSLLNRCWDSEAEERPADGNELAALLDAAVGIEASRERERPEVSPPAPESLRSLTLPARPEPPKPRERTPGEEVQFPLPGDLKMTFCWIPPGTAQLGSPKSELNRRADEDESQRGVFMSKGFWLGKYPVTQAEWHALTGKNPSYFQAGGGGKDDVKGLDTSRFPVEQVSWDMICGEDGFLEKMNALSNVLKVVFGAKGEFALPHEDEWEYACRGGKGNAQPFYWGTELNGTQANMYGNYPYGTEKKGPYLGRPCAVEFDSGGKYPKHPWGLFHTHGNVWEWCENLYDQTNGSTRVVRGGSWADCGRDCRAARRSWDAPGILSGFTGCRLVFRLDF